MEKLCPHVRIIPVMEQNRTEAFVSSRGAIVRIPSTGGLITNVYEELKPMVVCIGKNCGCFNSCTNKGG